MNEVELLRLITSIPFDLRAEVVVADLLASGYNETDLFIRPSGLFRRRFQKDIVSVEKTEYSNLQQSIFFNTSREGLYDMLPQTIMHNPPGKGNKSFKSTAEMIDDYKRRVAEEAEARKFFVIYEIEFYRQRIANALQERHLAESISYSMNDQEILSYWRLPSIFDDRQKGILFYLFPVFHKIRGALHYMMEVYSLILNQEVQITRTHEPPVLNFENTHSLGNMILSRNSVAGNSHSSAYPSFLIHIRNLEKLSFYDYIPGSKNLKLIEKLNEYFVPVFCETELRIEKQYGSWRMDDTLINESRLGFSSFI